MRKLASAAEISAHTTSSLLANATSRAAADAHAVRFGGSSRSRANASVCAENSRMGRGEPTKSPKYHSRGRLRSRIQALRTRKMRARTKTRADAIPSSLADCEGVRLRFEATDEMRRTSLLLLARPWPRRPYASANWHSTVKISENGQPCAHRTPPPSTTRESTARKFAPTEPKASGMLSATHSAAWRRHTTRGERVELWDEIHSQGVVDFYIPDLQRARDRYSCLDTSQ